MHILYSRCVYNLRSYKCGGEHTSLSLPGLNWPINDTSLCAKRVPRTSRFCGCCCLRLLEMKMEKSHAFAMDRAKGRQQRECVCVRERSCGWCAAVHVGKSRGNRRPNGHRTKACAHGTPKGTMLLCVRHYACSDDGGYRAPRVPDVSAAQRTRYR